jgi:hypothetical protein
MTRLPRRHAMTTIDPPPDWWADRWTGRQMEIRERVRDLLRPTRSYPPNTRHGVSCGTELWLFMRLVKYESGEVAHALDAMVADGMLVQTGAYYSLSTVRECPNAEA